MYNTAPTHNDTPKLLTLLGLIIADIVAAIILLVIAINLPTGPGKPTSVVGSYVLDYIQYGEQKMTSEDIFGSSEDGFKGEYALELYEDHTGVFSMTIVSPYATAESPESQTLTESESLDWKDDGNMIIHYTTFGMNEDKAVTWEASEDKMSICLIVPQQTSYSGSPTSGNMCFKRK
jgi:hypothetical protein